jgi:hypothetical protein
LAEVNSFLVCLEVDQKIRFVALSIQSAEAVPWTRSFFIGDHKFDISRDSELLSPLPDLSCPFVDAILDNGSSGELLSNLPFDNDQPGETANPPPSNYSNSAALPAAIIPSVPLASGLNAADPCLTLSSGTNGGLTTGAIGGATISGNPYSKLDSEANSKFDSNSLSKIYCKFFHDHVFLVDNGYIAVDIASTTVTFFSSSGTNGCSFQIHPSLQRTILFLLADAAVTRGRLEKIFMVIGSSDHPDRLVLLSVSEGKTTQNLLQIDPSVSYSASIKINAGIGVVCIQQNAKYNFYVSSGPLFVRFTHSTSQKLQAFQIVSDVFVAAFEGVLVLMLIADKAASWQSERPGSCEFQYIVPELLSRNIAIYCFSKGELSATFVSKDKLVQDEASPPSPDDSPALSQSFEAKLAPVASIHFAQYQPAYGSIFFVASLENAGPAQNVLVYSVLERKPAVVIPEWRPRALSSVRFSGRVMWTLQELPQLMISVTSQSCQLPALVAPSALRSVPLAKSLKKTEKTVDSSKAKRPPKKADPQKPSPRPPPKCSETKQKRVATASKPRRPKRRLRSSSSSDGANSEENEQLMASAAVSNPKKRLKSPSTRARSPTDSLNLPGSKRTNTKHQALKHLNPDSNGSTNPKAEKSHRIPSKRTVKQLKKPLNNIPSKRDRTVEITPLATETPLKPINIGLEDASEFPRGYILPESKKEPSAAGNKHSLGPSNDPSRQYAPSHYSHGNRSREPKNDPREPRISTDRIRDEVDNFLLSESD